MRNTVWKKDNYILNIYENGVNYYCPVHIKDIIYASLTQNIVANIIHANGSITSTDACFVSNDTVTVYFIKDGSIYGVDIDESGASISGDSEYADIIFNGDITQVNATITCNYELSEIKDLLENATPNVYLLNSNAGTTTVWEAENYGYVSDDNDVFTATFNNITNVSSNNKLNFTTVTLSFNSNGVSVSSKSSIDVSKDDLTNNTYLVNATVDTANESVTTTDSFTQINDAYDDGMLPTCKITDGNKVFYAPVIRDVNNGDISYSFDYVDTIIDNANDEVTLARYLITFYVDNSGSEAVDAVSFTYETVTFSTV